ncbi:Cation transport ATPase [Beggiatoa sp. PS]|nr:Cation transport ATPase [Beggiatoa sp. PS]
MLIEAGILLSAYIGTRFFEKRRKALTLKKKNKALTKKAKNNLQSYSNRKAIKKQQQEKVFERRFKVSLFSFGASSLRQFISYTPLAFLNIGLYIYNFSYLREAEQALIQKRKIIDRNVVYAVLFLSSIATNQYLVAGYWDVFYFYATKIKKKLEDQSKNMLLNVFEQQPRSAWILKDNVEIEMPLEAIEVNDIVIISAGEVVPIDGVIINGNATLDQHTLTGESQPVEKEVGDRVFAATVVITGRIEVSVEKAGKDTTVAKVGHILNNTIDYKTTIQLKGEEWADKGMLPQLGITGLALVTTGPIVALAILNTNFGYRVQMITYLQTINHLNLASRQGILIKDGRSLELLTQIDTILFDKTGTLTKEEQTVGRILVYHHYQEDELLTYAAAAERKLTHPIAQAIFNKAVTSQLTLPKVADSEYKMGYGITVNIEGKIIQVGSARFMKLENITIPTSIMAEMVYSHDQGYSFVMVAIDKQLCGAIEIQPTIRPEVKLVIKNLRQSGIKHLAIVSGDHKQATQLMAKELGMDDYFYEVMPENKANIVENLQKQGHSVCFIGDGINDAIAMKKAQVSISLRGASSIATDVAQVVLMDGSLSHLGELFKIANNLDTRLKRSLIIGIMPTPIVIAGGFLFHLGIISSVIINNIALFSGVGYAMNTKRQHEKTTKQVFLPNVK